MLTPSPSARSKRPGSDPPVCEQRPRKRRRDCDKANLWDSLSRVWLTRAALVELDRRSSASQLVPSLPPLPYASGDIASFARHGGPDLSDLRNYPSSGMSGRRGRRRSVRGRPSSQSRARSRAQSQTRSQTQLSSKSSPYDANFQQLLTDHHVYFPGYKHPDGTRPPTAANLTDLETRLSRQRADMSVFDRQVLEQVRDINDNVNGERSTVDALYPILEGVIPDLATRATDTVFGNLEDLIAYPLTAPKPDLFHGARPGQIHTIIRNQLSGKIEPSSNTTFPAAPNFYLAAKGTNGSPAVGTRQATYDGAIGARAIHALESFRSTPVFDNRIKAISCMYSSGQLVIYGTHLMSRESGNVSYHIQMLGGYSLIGNLESCRQGITAFRNAMDCAKDIRNQAIDEANQRVTRSTRPTSVSSAPTAHRRDLSNLSESETSMDELAMEPRNGRPGKRTRTAPAATDCA